MEVVLSEINWGSVADWLAASGSILASVVALHLARSGQKVNMSAQCGRRVIIGGRSKADLASILVANTGDRPFRISAISIRYGLLKKHHGIIKIGAATEHCEALLRVLNDGDQAHFGFELKSDTNWVADMSKYCRHWLDVKTIRVTIHCTNGQKRVLKPERELLRHIYEGVRKRKSADVPTDKP
jgi:hypothetical protein